MKYTAKMVTVFAVNVAALHAQGCNCWQSDADTSSIIWYPNISITVPYACYVSTTAARSFFSDMYPQFSA